MAENFEMKPFVKNTKRFSPNLRRIGSGDRDKRLDSSLEHLNEIMDVAGRQTHEAQKQKVNAEVFDPTQR
jgi:hypothetical protein